MKIFESKQMFIYKIMVRLGMVFPRPFEVFAVKGANLIGVEIGVYEAEHAVSMLKRQNIKKLYLIDPYICKEFGNLEQAKKTAIKTISRYNNCELIIKKSKNCKKIIPNELDFVYIDGSHTYESVKEDIENYYPKLRVGGILGGHDFDFDHTEVIKAIIEFSVKNNYILYVKDPDWWIVKEGECEK